ncbi:MAG: RsiV family protein [Eubacterium sp.]|nr:RsiV family protein [Eubacterium sp.]
MDNRNQFDKLKEEYKSVSMTDDQLDALRSTIDDAKKTHEEQLKVSTFPGSRVKKIVAAAAVLAIVFVSVPNLSVQAANAMEQIPIIGSIVKLVTIRNYTANDGQHSADITTEEIQTDDEKLESSVEDVNSRIEAFSDQYIYEYEQQLKEDGYTDIKVDSEVINTSDDYFTLKLTCVETAADSAETSEYYTIDLESGDIVKLADLFAEDADYVTPISESVKSQMRAQMKADENVIYFIDQDIEDEEFTGIDADEDFYVNEDGEVVICFDEGTVAPYYMGSVEFVIPDDVLSDIR